MLVPGIRKEISWTYYLDLVVQFKARKLNQIGKPSAPAKTFQTLGVDVFCVPEKCEQNPAHIIALRGSARISFTRQVSGESVSRSDGHAEVRISENAVKLNPSQ